MNSLRLVILFAISAFFLNAQALPWNSKEECVRNCQNKQINFGINLGVCLKMCSNLFGVTDHTDLNSCLQALGTKALKTDVILQGNQILFMKREKKSIVLIGRSQKTFCDASGCVRHPSSSNAFNKLVKQARTTLDHENPGEKMVLRHECKDAHDPAVQKLIQQLNINSPNTVAPEGTSATPATI